MSDDSIQLKVEQDADVTVIRILTARIPVDLSEAFEETVVRTVDQLADPKVLLDFAGVDFLSSAVLGKLIKLNGVVTDRGGQLKLSSLDARIAEVFKITNLDKLFSIYKTPDAALKSFK